MDWKAKLEAARDSGQKIFDHQSQAIMEEHWPQIQNLFQEKVGPAALAAAEDNAKMELLFRIVYSVLPSPVKVVVKEGTFIQFCFSHRDQLLPPVNPTGNAARR